MICFHQLIHSTVVDTSIVFPHRLGLPYKRALRNLMADHLKRIIQDNGENSFSCSVFFASKRQPDDLEGSSEKDFN